MKDQINNRLEQIWNEVTEEMLYAKELSDLKKIFVAYGFLENVILNVSEDLKDPELKVRLLNYCEFARKAVSDYNPNASEEPEVEAKPSTATILKFPPK